MSSNRAANAALEFDHIFTYFSFITILDILSLNVTHCDHSDPSLRRDILVCD